MFQLWWFWCRGKNFAGRRRYGFAFHVHTPPWLGCLPEEHRRSSGSSLGSLALVRTKQQNGKQAGPPGGSIAPETRGRPVTDAPPPPAPRSGGSVSQPIDNIDKYHMVRARRCLYGHQKRLREERYLAFLSSLSDSFPLCFL